MSRMLLLLVFFFTLILPFSACQASLSYGKVVFEDIEEGIAIDDPTKYLSDSKYDKYRVAQTMIVPQIKAIGGNEYAIDFTIYSLDEKERIIISQVELLHNGRIVELPLNEISVPLHNENGFYTGAERYGQVSQDFFCIANNDLLQLQCKICIIGLDGCVTEKLQSYSAIVYQSKALVLPT